MFTKDQRSTFPYWFAHWCAFQMTALNLGIWKFKYLFHDCEKPWLKLFLPYEKVQKLHRTHHNHHLMYEGKLDLYALIIDWECSRFTKNASPLNARQTWERHKNSDYEDLLIKHPELKEMDNILNKLGL